MLQGTLIVVALLVALAGGLVLPETQETGRAKLASFAIIVIGFSLLIFATYIGSVENRPFP